MKKKLALLVVALVASAAIAGLWLLKSRDDLRSPARKAWKEQAIFYISGRGADRTWLTNELSGLNKRAAGGSSDSDAWLAANLLVMTNGEWMIFTNMCQKENWRIRDIFIGKGSDRKWYFSTYHFCVRMLVLKMEDQPQSLAEFAGTYSLREFDGKSDDCLVRTWPPKKP